MVREKVLEESDNDDDGKISFTEFTHIVSRAPDFLRSVCGHLKINFVISK